MYIEYVGWDRIRPIFWSLNICFSSITLKDEKSTRLLQKGDTAWFGFPRLDFLSVSSIVQAGRQEDDSSREARWTTRAEKQRCRGEKARAQEQEWWPVPQVHWTRSRARTEADRQTETGRRATSCACEYSAHIDGDALTPLLQVILRTDTVELRTVNICSGRRRARWTDGCQLSRPVELDYFH
jgi:hypothetical protein